MTNHYFTTREFRVTDKGIELLRYGFNYRTIEFRQIIEIEIKKAKELNNWVGVLTLGMVLLVGGLYICLGIANVLLNEFSPRMMMFSLVPVAGAYTIYASLQTGTVLRVKYDNGATHKYLLEEIIKENKLDDFKKLMKDKLGSKVSVD